MIDNEKRIHELTMLYLEKQNLLNLTPEELLDKYTDTYERIRKHGHQESNSKWFT